MDLKIDFSTTGVMNVTDTNDITVFSLSLSQYVTSAPANQTTFTSPATVRTGYQIVNITYNTQEGNERNYVIDIRDVKDGGGLQEYATTQELIDAIEAAVAAL